MYNVPVTSCGLLEEWLWDTGPSSLMRGRVRGRGLKVHTEALILRVDTHAMR